MEGTPEGVEVAAVRVAVTAIPGVKGIHDLHIWSISSSDLALSAHLEVDEAALAEGTNLAASVKDMLARDFGIGHVTLELEREGEECSGSTCDLTPEVLGENGRHLGHHH
jgi:cobalt-zinc-cadmium efflux system protein